MASRSSSPWKAMTFVSPSTLTSKVEARVAPEVRAAGGRREAVLRRALGGEVEHEGVAVVALHGLHKRPCNVGMH